MNKIFSLNIRFVSGIILGFVAGTEAAFAADLNVTGNITATGTIDSDGNSQSFGTQSTSTPLVPGAVFTYTDSSIPASGGVDSFKHLVNRSSASWLWLNGPNGGPFVNAMRLDNAHQLLLFNAAGTTAGVTLTPGSNQLSLGTAMLTGIGNNLKAEAGLTVTGALTASNGITNTNGVFTGGAAGLNLGAGGTNQNITLTPSGTGYTLLSGKVGIGVTSPLSSLHIRSGTNKDIQLGSTAGAFTSAASFTDFVSLNNTLNFSRPSDGAFSESVFSYNSASVSNLGLASRGGIKFVTGAVADRGMIITEAGNVGIGTTNPITPLQVTGPITAGSSLGSTSGVDYLYGNYGDGKLAVLGSQYSSGAPFLGYSVKAKPGAAGYLASTSIPIARSSIEANNGYVAFLTGPTQSSTDGGAVTVYERMRIDSVGNVGIGTTSPQARLQLGSYSDGAGEATNHGDLLFSKQNTSLAATGGIEWKIAPDNYGAKIDTISAGGANLVFGLRNNSAVWTESMRINPNGNVGIGTTTPTHKLSVNGTIRAKEIIVDTGWADYVFDENYALAPLSEVESHIKEHKHLPGIPSATEIAEHGVSMGDMQSKLLSKVEELTLHLIAQEKRLIAQQSAHDQEIAVLKAQNANFLHQLDELKGMSH